MLANDQTHQPTATADSDMTDPPAAAATPAAAGIIATRLAGALQDGDVLYIAADEQRAEAVAVLLRQAAPGADVVHCPSSDALPGDDAPASPSNVGRRVAALRRARLAGRPGKRPSLAFISTAEAAARACASPAAFDLTPPVLATGDALEGDALGAMLEEIGYVADDRVDEPGEVAVRGLVIDLYPADAEMPVRVEIGDGRITSLRAYDPVTQLSGDTLDRIEIGRVAEPSAGDDWTTLFDHVPHAAVALDPGAAVRRDRFVALAADAARHRRDGPAEPISDAADWDRALADRRMIDIAAGTETPGERFIEGRIPARRFRRVAGDALARGDRVMVLGAARDLRFLAPRLATLLKVAPIRAESWVDAMAMAPGSLVTLEMAIDRGWADHGVTVVAAADLLGSRASSGQEAAHGPDPLRVALGDIRLGDLVVHEAFGVGTVAGLEPVADENDAGDAIVLDYAAGARRLVPVDDAARLWRYGGDAEAVALDRLDGASWVKRRGEIEAAIAESARGLVELAHARNSRTAPVIEPDAAGYERFVDGFPFTETVDQARAISAVREDLATGKPMDRLVVGDVGYGKTEIALRAAAMAVLAGYQVAIAAPTTVLVRQHLEAFRKRFPQHEVASLSRLSTAAEKRATLAGLEDGSTAIVIGTGAVAGKNVRYRKLALVVIDEEQRFGTADKARLRALCGDGHVLTLTATPIPRTLQMALIGLQQVSVIATPPARRQPIRTSVQSFDPATIRTALLREKSRGGQSFVVVPRIEDMEPLAEKLRKLVPDLSLHQAHGKLPAVEIDAALVRFAAGDGDILLATNIIETGLDVPRANTMIVWRADRFGLSQLHQLRGRVGRGGRRGQIVLTTEADTPIADRTLRRLGTLATLDRLGAGFAISARDLDMRGAGDLLGDDQAGHMRLIGVDLYQHLLEAALRTARGETVDDWTPVLKLGVPGRLPEAWIPEAEIRIGLYCRLARLDDAVGIDAFEAEIEDRFGMLPPEAHRLLATARLKALARTLGVERIDAGPSAIAFTMRGGQEPPAAIAHLLERKGERLLLQERIELADARMERIQALFEDAMD
ncbi:TRCF domain-containing protein [Sphingomonas sp. ZT3P38]|uniref:helicase-related protein n=1 Tax=Parasphingomonas zepuensis TaxID=3096161 RepID=UPI002FC8732D